jgi:Transposase
MMKRVRFTEDQIIAVLREHEAGAKTGDLARKHGVSEGVRGLIDSLHELQAVL